MKIGSRYVILALLGMFCGSAIMAQTVLTAAEVRRLALSSNRQVLSSHQEIAKAEAEIRKARAGIFPDVNANAGYQRNFEIPSFFIFSEDGPMELKTGSKNNFNASVTVRQPLWEGGKVLNAWAIARLYRQYTSHIDDGVKSEIGFTAEILFYHALLQKAQLEVIDRALAANEKNLSMVEQKHSQGLVSDYELLRAKVERNNLLPGQLAAQSEVRLSEKRLASFLGLPLSQPMTLVDEVEDTSLAWLLPLSALLDSALHNRPEVLASKRLVEITGKAIAVAKGEYQPSVDAVAQYSWQSQSDRFALREHSSDSWTAGVRISVPVFKGGKTGGEVATRKAERQQAILAASQTEDDVRLEVEQGYDQMMQAKKSLDVQGETIAQAEEGLRIASLRYDQGVGTQLEVLSAQTALTDARRALAQAMNSFRTARANLRKVTTIEAVGI